MNITDLVNDCLKESIDKLGENDIVVKMSKELMTLFGYKVLEEIARLNCVAFTILDDNDFSKQGFGNMLLNYLVDKEDKEYGKIHFNEYEAWRDNSIEKPRTSTTNYYIVVELSNGKYDFAKWDNETETWINQDNKILTNVIKWREFNRQVL